MTTLFTQKMSVWKVTHTSFSLKNKKQTVVASFCVPDYLDTTQLRIFQIFFNFHVWPCFNSDASNYCRNMNSNGDSEPWCYTTDPDTRTEVCDVCSCNPGLLNFPKSRLSLVMMYQSQHKCFMSQIQQQRKNARKLPRGKSTEEQ